MGSKKIFDILHDSNLTIINSTHDKSKFPDANGLIAIDVDDEVRSVKYNQILK